MGGAPLQINEIVSSPRTQMKLLLFLKEKECMNVELNIKILALLKIHHLIRTVQTKIEHLIALDLFTTSLKKKNQKMLMFLKNQLKNRKDKILETPISNVLPASSQDPGTPPKYSPPLMELPPQESISPQPAKKRGDAAKIRAAFYKNTKNNIRSSDIVVKPHNLFERNRFRAKHRSRSPQNQEEGNFKAKVVRIDSDSENKENPVAKNESEIQLDDVDFDTSSDTTEENEEGSQTFENENNLNADEEEFKLTKNDCVIMASIKLPLKVVKDNNGKFQLLSSGSLLFTQMYYLQQSNYFKAAWVGLPNYFPESEEEIQELTELFKQHDCYPVFIDRQLSDSYFNYWQNIMKPLFYNFKGLYDDIGGVHHYDDWACFKTLNEKFSEKIIEVKDIVDDVYSNSYIWLNNHQLFLVPQYLRRKIKDSHIGMYFHSPFPSSDIFKIFPYRNQLLKSILECDCIGFHAYEHARHFMFCCKRVLGIETEMAKGGHFIINPKSEKAVIIRIGHAGVQINSIVKIIRSEKFKNLLAKRKDDGRIIISAIDILCHYYGIRAKLIAFSKFLRLNPTFQRDCKLILHLTAPKVFVEENLQLTYDSIIELK